MLLTAFYIVLGSFAAPCQQDGDHIVTCQVNKCETVGSAEICTECKVGGVPVDGFCRPFGSIQAAAAGCTKADGAALDKMTATCEKCGDGYFLFMGGCYKTTDGPGSEICTKAEGGLCTECKTANGLFKNPATPQKPGSECILCHDATNRNGVMGVDNCLKCTAPGGNTGAATCTECMAGTYKKSDTECAACHSDCATCSGANQNQCTSCETGKYLKGTECVDKGTCNNNHYPDDTSMTCVACTVLDANCATCSFDSATAKGKCLTCNSNKIPRTTLDGTSTCVENSYAGCQGADNELFMKEDQSACLLCGDTKDVDNNNKGKEGCKTCTKSADGSPPTCTACLDGYFFEQSSNTCEACGANCVTCSAKTDETKCKTCKEGFFLAGTGEGKCISCENGNDSGYSGLAGCLSCTAPAAPGPASCNRCKIGYKLQGTTCVKTCEDTTACGGTSGACDAIVIDDKGNTKHYCSYCGDSGKFPIDGICTDSKGTNAGCTDHICSYCAQGYFLYMGGCYSTASPPGNYMCKTAEGGKCTAVNDGNRYFIVPEAKATDQSVLACSNPLGTLVGTDSAAKAYVGVLNCSQCKAPAALTEAGMTAAVCTSCDSGKKPNRDGSGCVTCSVGDCKSCVMDDVCGECSDGYSLEGGKCVSSGSNRSGLSTGAIAGISVAVIVVVGGLIGFLCWWFICRGKA
ncbi:VSP [Giardia duodenalis]|uniref:VSP n=1 Tax=Giardia intestinalis (strain ATCC 50803 / WB clone C6) TaxID=184922 RepID=A0A644EWT4_GIAIC|nr:VSP [Giardia intestinalis]KAE8301208.1 VSP [Giardia intestinalis]